jgi:hypothetical protein
VHDVDATANGDVLRGIIQLLGEELYFFGAPTPYVDGCAMPLMLP